MATFPKILPRYKIALYSLIIFKPLLRFLLGSPQVTKSIESSSYHKLRGFFIYIPDPTQILPFKDLVQAKFFDISYFKNDIYILFLIICTGILIFLIYRWLATYFFYRQLSKEKEINHYTWKKLYNFIDATCKQLKIKKVRLLESWRVSSPFTVGILQPTIIFPIAVLNNLTESEIKQVALHEIMHIKRRDSLKKWILTIFGDILFFVPPVHFARKKIYEYIELDCDLRTVHFEKNPKDLANGLLKIANLIRESKLANPKSLVISNMSLVRSPSLKYRIISFTKRKTLITKTWRTTIFYILYALFLIYQISISITLNGKPFIL
jgi:beta-lactamase regulating signal transducer with metallopeptidase domain